MVSVPIKRSVDDVLRHEIGHFLGLNHACTPDTNALMCETSTTDTRMGILRPIGSDAQAAMATWYLNAAKPTPAPVLTGCERRAAYSNGAVVTKTLQLTECQ